MALAFAFISTQVGSNVLLVGIFLLYFSYWSIFHLITAEIQKNTPPEFIAGVVSARNILMLLVIALGEFAVGFVFSKVSITTELIIRGAFCGMVFLFAAKRFNKNYI
ncbi:MAG: hypothetical protein V4596_09800 [Bdellovibrionota bacterium]